MNTVFKQWPPKEMATRAGNRRLAKAQADALADSLSEDGLSVAADMVRVLGRTVADLSLLLEAAEREISALKKQAEVTP